MIGDAPPRLSFSLPLEPSRLLRARHRIHDYLDSHGVSAADVEDVVLAVEEAMTNAVRHSQAQENLEVRLGFVGSQLYAEVRDRGVGLAVETFDRDAVPDPLAAGGRGLFIISRLMDVLELRSDGDGLTVQMLKRDVLDAAAGHSRERAILAADTLVPDLSYRVERQRTLVEEIAEGFAALDWEYRFIYANDFSLRLYGMERDEVLGARAWDLFPYLRENELGRALRDAMEYGTPSILDYESPHLGRILEYRVYPTRAGLSFYARDITERKRRERERDELFDALSRSEERFRAVFESNPDAAFLTRPDGSFDAANAAACRMYGYTEGEIRSLGRADFLDSADPRLAVALAERAEKGVIQGVELTGIRRDGTRFPVEVDSVVLAGERPLAWVVQRDITERKRAEEALRTGEERFGAALRNAPVSVAAQDLDLVYTWAFNQRTAPQDQIVGLRDADIFTPEEAARITTTKRRVITEDTELREQFWLDRPVGRRYYDVTWAPLHDEEGRVIGVSSATVDLTEGQLAAEKLRDQAEELLLSRERLDAELARTRLLQDVAGAASEGLEVGVIAEQTLGALQTHLHLKGGDIRLVEGGSLRLVASFDYPDEHVELLRSVELEASQLLGARAVREGVVLSHEDEAPSPERRLTLERQGIAEDRYVYVPIEDHEEVLGLLSLTFAGRRAFRDDEFSLFRAIARTLGQAMRNARLLRTERELSLLLGALARIDELVHSSLEADEIMARALEEGGAALRADAAAVVLHERGRFIVSHVWQLSSEVLGVVPEDRDARAMLALPVDRPVAIDDVAQDPRLDSPFVHEWGIKSVIAVPLHVRGRDYGVLYLTYTTESHRFTPAEVEFASRLGASLSSALENASLYEEQRRIAETLQGYLVHPLPEIPGLELATMSLAASAVELIGGDFSHVSRLPDGRAFILIGDVAGKGIQAAGMTETVRSSMRAFASIDATPAFVLRKTNELLQGNGRRDPYVTALVCVVDPRTRRVSLGSAGHPAPVHLSAVSCAILEPQYGPPLGAFAADYQTVHLTLAAGDALVLYTDGVTEARRGNELFGELRLAKVVESLRGQTAEAMARGVAEAAIAYGGSLRDDLNIVVAKLT